MESQPSDPAASTTARAQLTAARRAHEAALRRVIGPAWVILVISAFCGIQTVAPAYRGPGSALTVVMVVLLMVALLRLAARNGWVAMRAWPKPRWNAGELALIAAAVLIGGVVGPHLLAGDAASAPVSWGLGAAVAVGVAACLYGARISYRHRVSRPWRR